MGDEDAKKLEDGFSTFTVRDLQNLRVGEAICRIDRLDWDFSLSTLPVAAASGSTGDRRDRVIETSRQTYAGAPAAVALALGPAADATAPGQERTVQQPVQDNRDTRGISGVLNRQAPALPGRGGAQHKYLQELIRRWGEAKGWRVTIEKPILNGLGSVDVALENGDTSVACEIGCSTSPEHELQNLQKCLAAGFTEVVSVVVNGRSVPRFRAVIQKNLDPADSERTRVLAPEDLFEFLEQLIPSHAHDRHTTRGYKIRVKHSKPSPGNLAARAVAQTVVGALNRLRRAPHS